MSTYRLGACFVDDATLWTSFSDEKVTTSNLCVYTVNSIRLAQEYKSLLVLYKDRWTFPNKTKDSTKRAHPPHHKTDKIHNIIHILFVRIFAMHLLIVLQQEIDMKSFNLIGLGIFRIKTI